MSTFDLDRKEAKQETLVLADPSFQEERTAVRDLVERVQTLQADGDYHQFQLDLMGKVKLMQDAGDDLRRREGNAQARIQELVSQQPKPIEQLKAEGEQLKLLQHKHRVVKALRWIYLSIGDALAWRLLGYDRGAITLLSQGTRVARFAADEGLKPELEALDAWWDKGLVAIHNDLTTCLRHGDVTAVDGQANAVYLEEVKRTRTLSQTSPQVARIEAVTRLVMEGRVEPPGEMPMNLHRLDTAYRNHLDALGPLLTRAREDGYAAGRAGSCYYVQVFRFDSGHSEEEIRADLDATQQEDWWLSSETRQVSWDTTRRRLRDRHYSLGGLAPLPIYPLDYEDLTDLIMGFVDVRTILDIDPVVAAFEKRGLEVTLPEPDRWGEEFLHVSRIRAGRKTTTVLGALLREQMLNELMDPDSAIATAEALLEIRAARGGREEMEGHAVTLSDEPSAWRREEHS